jgi:hypothetical protein
MILDFNASGTYISNSTKIVKYEYIGNIDQEKRPFIYGLEFSENGWYCNAQQYRLQG